jgi:DNA-binding PadR family transcriptional regulator
MKLFRSNKPHPDGGTIDPKLDKDLDDLVKKGYIKKFYANNQVMYDLTPLGEKYAEEVLLKEDRNKPRDIKNLE